MHQPFYRDMATGEHILPWVRLHALKDYWGMVALLKEFPSVKVTFNLVPSLLVQLEAFAKDEAVDPHLTIGLKPADALTDQERTYCVENFFRAHRPRMIDPYPRYAELLALRDRAVGDSRARAAQFSSDDLRDLQVWHKLSWIDAQYLERDDRARALVAKGRGFTEEDKQRLRMLELELLRSVVPEYRNAAARGQVELSTSPFYHPILPLLCDTDVYLVTHPHSNMPRERFQHPGDAAEQLSRACVLHERLFGQRPRGLWPSEGSVSDAMIPLVAEQGFSWMATDEGILSKTLGSSFTRNAEGHLEQPDLLYRPYRVGGPGGQVACGFRDHTMSDLIGFSYASWSAEAAADDFVRRLTEAGRRYSAKSRGEEATIFVILDGENAWEYYDGQGRPFLRALYGRLAAQKDLATVTMAEACASAVAPLPSIFPGSWINNDFYIWIGHQDDHRAWSQLGDARRALDASARSAEASAVAAAREELLIAEGSDWFWWYGDDHSSENDLEFDALFRGHLRNAYRLLGQLPPEELFVSNVSTTHPVEEVHPPTSSLNPVLDGEVTSYFEWMGAGYVTGDAAGGAMHRTSETGSDAITVTFGLGGGALLIRVDADRPMRQALAAGLELSLNFLQPPGVRVRVNADAGTVEALVLDRTRDGKWVGRDANGVSAAVGDIAEIRVPFRSLGLAAGERVAFTVGLNRDDAQVDQQPRSRAIELVVEA